MIDLRMVADDRGYTQLQVRSFCIQRGWTEWKSVPIVHDPSQLVDRIEVFDAKTSCAKPDGGLTGKQLAWWLKPDVGLTGNQLAELMVKLAAARKFHEGSLSSVSGNSASKILVQGMLAGFDECFLYLQNVLGQPAEPEIDL